MAIRVRYFVFEEGGALKHVPHRVSEGLHLGEDAIPEYASTRQRVAEVILDNEAGKPIRIRDARGRFWSFRDDGRLNQDDLLTFMRWYDPMRERPKGKVVDLRPDFERKKWEREHLWDLNAQDLDRITAAVWPHASGEPDGGIQSVKGKAKKVPPLTRDGEEALRKIRSAIIDMEFAMRDLSEPALKGLAFELHRIARLYPQEQSYYEAAAAAADRQREIRARHRTGGGAWYATLSVSMWNEARTEGQEIETVEERHESRSAAIEAARRLLAEHAHRFDRHVTVEADVISELEWAPMKADRSEDEVVGFD
jgi:hypothetical protein